MKTLFALATKLSFSLASDSAIETILRSKDIDFVIGGG